MTSCSTPRAARRIAFAIAVLRRVPVRDHREPAQARAGRRRRRYRGRGGGGDGGLRGGSAGRRACRGAVATISSRSPCDHRPDRAFDRLQGDVAGEAVGDDHVGRLGEQVAALGVAARSSARSPPAARAPRASAGSPSPAPRRSRAGAPRARGWPRISSRRSAPCARTGAGAPGGRRRSRRSRAARTGRRARGSARRSPGAAPRAGGGSRGVRPRASRPCSRRRRPRRPSLGDRAARGDQRAVRLRANRLGGLLVHRDHLLGDDVLEPARVERGRAEEDRDDPVRRGLERAATTSSGPRSPPIASTATLTGLIPARRCVRASGSTSRPLYVLQFGQTRCGRFGWPQVGQTLTRGASMPCWARRLSRRDLEVFFFGTAMAAAAV